jgi:hypothetical protein
MAVNFSNALLLETHFCGAILSRANLSGATLWKADFRGVKALTPHEVKSAQNWEEAIYDEDFRKELGLPTESRNDKQNS